MFSLSSFPLNMFFWTTGTKSMHFYAPSRLKGYKDMSLSQMKHEAKYQIFIPRIWCL